MCLPQQKRPGFVQDGRGFGVCFSLETSTSLQSPRPAGRVRPADSGLGGGGTRRSHREEPPPRGPSLSGRRGPVFLLPLSYCYCDSFDYMHFTAVGGGVEGNIRRPCYQKKKKRGNRGKKERERKEGKKREEKKSNFRFPCLYFKSTV